MSRNNGLIVEQNRVNSSKMFGEILFLHGSMGHLRDKVGQYFRVKRAIYIERLEKMYKTAALIILNDINIGLMMFSA